MTDEFELRNISEHPGFHMWRQPAPPKELLDVTVLWAKERSERLRVQKHFEEYRVIAQKREQHFSIEWRDIASFSFGCFVFALLTTLGRLVL